MAQMDQITLGVDTPLKLINQPTNKLGKQFCIAKMI